MQTVSIFADVQNIYYTTRQHYQRSFNYNYLWRQVTQNRQVIKAYAYAIDRGDKQQQRFQNILRGIGFEVKLKPYIQREDGSAKGDWDVGITLDCFEAATESDVVVLLSGDGDFDLLLQRISKRYGTQSEVYGVPHWTAGSLIRAADRYIPISEDFLL